MVNVEGVNDEGEDADWRQQREDLGTATQGGASESFDTQNFELLKAKLLQDDTQGGAEGVGRNAVASSREEGEIRSDDDSQIDIVGSSKNTNVNETTDQADSQPGDSQFSDIQIRLLEESQFGASQSILVNETEVNVDNENRKDTAQFQATQRGETQLVEDLRRRVLENAKTGPGEDSDADEAVVDVIDRAAVAQTQTQDTQFFNNVKAKLLEDDSIAGISQPEQSTDVAETTGEDDTSERLNTQASGNVVIFPKGTSFGGNKLDNLGESNGDLNTSSRNAHSAESLAQDSFLIELQPDPRTSCARCADRTPDQPFCSSCGAKLDTLNSVRVSAPAQRKPPIKIPAKRTRQKPSSKPRIEITITEETEQPPYAQAEKLQAQLQKKMEDWKPGPESHGSQTQKISNSYAKTQQSATSQASATKSNRSQETESFEVDHTLHEGDSGYINLIPPETQADEVSQDKGFQAGGMTFRNAESNDIPPETPSHAKSFLGQTSVAPFGATQMFANTQSSPMNPNYMPSSTQKAMPSPGMGIESPTVANYTSSMPGGPQNAHSSSAFNITDRVTSSFAPFDSGTPAKVGWNTTMMQIKNGVVNGYKFTENQTKLYEGAMERAKGLTNPLSTYETMAESQERRRLTELAKNPPRPPPSDDGFDDEEEAANRRRAREKKRRDDVERQYAGVVIPRTLIPASNESPKKKGKGRGKKGSAEPDKASSPAKVMRSPPKRVPAQSSPAKANRSSQPEVIADSQATGRNEADISTQAPSSIGQDVDMLQDSFAQQPSQPQGTRSSAKLPPVAEDSDEEPVSRDGSQSPSVRVPRTSSRRTPQLVPTTSAMSGEVIPETSPNKPFDPDDLVADSPMPHFSQMRFTQPTQDGPEPVASPSPVKRRSNLRQPKPVETKSASTTPTVKRTYGKQVSPNKATHRAKIMSVEFERPAIDTSDSEDDPTLPRRDISPTKFGPPRKSPAVNKDDELDGFQPIRIGKPRVQTARKRAPPETYNQKPTGRRARMMDDSDEEVAAPKGRATTRKSTSGKKQLSTEVVQDSDEEDEVAPPKSRASKRASVGRKQLSAEVVHESSDEEDVVAAPKSRAAKKASASKKQLSAEVVQESSDEEDVVAAPKTRAEKKTSASKKQVTVDTVLESSREEDVVAPKAAARPRRKVSVAVMDSSDVEMEDAPYKSVSPLKPSVEHVPASERASSKPNASQSVDSMKMPCPPYSAGYPCAKAHEHDGFYHDEDIRALSIKKREANSPLKSRSPTKSVASPSTRQVSLDLPKPASAAQSGSGAQSGSAYHTARQSAPITSSPLSAIPSDFDEDGYTATQGYERRSQGLRKSKSSSRDTSAPLLHSDSVIMPPPTVSRKLFDAPKNDSGKMSAGGKKVVAKPAASAKPKAARQSRASIDFADEDEGDVAIVKETPAPSRTSRTGRRGSSKPTYADLSSADSDSGKNNKIAVNPSGTKNSTKAAIGKMPASQLFKGMAFAISYRDSKAADESDKNELIALIKRNGGRIIDDFKDLFILDGTSALATPSISRASSHANLGTRKPSPRKPSPAELKIGELELSPLAKTLGFVALIGDHYTRKSKFIQALALSLPCLSAAWIRKCVQRQKIVTWKYYLLAAGEATELGGAVVSRMLPTYGAADARFKDVFANRARMLQGKKVVFLMGKGKGATEERKKAYLFLTRALGAEEVKRVANVAEMKRLIETGDGWQLVFVDDKVKLAEAEREVEKLRAAEESEAAQAAAALIPPPADNPAPEAGNATDTNSRKRKRTSSISAADAEAETEAQQPKKKKVRVVSDEFVMQSLIVGSLGEELESSDSESESGDDEGEDEDVEMGGA